MPVTATPTPTPTPTSSPPPVTTDDGPTELGGVATGQALAVGMALLLLLLLLVARRLTEREGDEPGE